MKEINYKGYIIEPVQRKGREVYRVSNGKGKYLINRPAKLTEPMSGPLLGAYKLLGLEKTPLFVSVKNKYKHVSITYQLSVDRCKSCIEDVINGSYTL